MNKTKTTNLCEVNSRINIEVPCKRCGLETFKLACSDPYCQIAQMEDEIEKLDHAILDRDTTISKLEKDLEWFKDLHSRVVLGLQKEISQAQKDIMYVINNTNIHDDGHGNMLFPDRETWLKRPSVIDAEKKNKGN